MRKIVITLILMSVTLSNSFGQVAAVFDEQTFAQRALNFFREFSETVEQGMDQAEQLALEYKKYEERTQKVRDEVADIAKLTKKIIVLYKELEYCLNDLETLKKELARSNYLSVEEKYELFSMGKNVCQNLLDKKDQIDETVKECRNYSSNKTAKDKKEDLEDLIAEIRNTRKKLMDLKGTAIKIIAEKKALLENQLELQRCFSVELFH